MTWKDKIEDNSVVETFLNQILEWQDVKEHYYPIFPSIIFLLLFFQGIKTCNPSDVASAIFSAVRKFKPVQHVKQVTVVVFQNDMAAEFIAELKKDVHTHRYKDTRSEEHCKSIKIKETK
jgi:hypothetical protein